ncbi:hypothetical protein JRQ81_016892, partial [Phrynocephalus forsythii]
HPTPPPHQCLAVPPPPPTRVGAVKARASSEWGRDTFDLHGASNILKDCKVQLH